MKITSLTDACGSTLVELLEWRAAHQPDRLAYTFLADGQDMEAHLTYGELAEKARALGARLQKEFSPGDRALLLYPNGLDYIEAFFGSLYAGLIAVPAYPPRSSNLKRGFARLEAIIKDACPPLALTTPDLASALEQKLAY